MLHKKKRLHVRGMNKHTLKGKKESLSGVNLLDTNMNAQFLCSSLCLDNPTMLYMRHNDGKHYNEDEKSSPFINGFFFCAYSSVCFHRCFKRVNWDYVNIRKKERNWKEQKQRNCAPSWIEIWRQYTDGARINVNPLLLLTPCVHSYRSEVQTSPSTEKPIS